MINISKKVYLIDLERKYTDYFVNAGNFNI